MSCKTFDIIDHLSYMQSNRFFLPCTLDFPPAQFINYSVSIELLNHLSTKIPHHYSFEKPVQVLFMLLLLGGGTALSLEYLLGNADWVLT